MIKKLIFVSSILAGLIGCANPPQITKSPVTEIASVLSPSGGTDMISQGILNAQYNFNQAVQLGILSATDPAPGCLNSVATMLGLGASAPPGFTPRVTDLISAGSVGYIYIQQLKTLTGSSLQVSPACMQLIGQIVIDANRAGLRLGAGALGGVGLGILPPVIP